MQRPVPITFNQKVNFNDLSSIKGPEDVQEDQGAVNLQMDELQKVFELFHTEL